MPEYGIYLPEQYSKTMGFNFVFSVNKLTKKKQKTITPSPELINSTGGFEETRATFFTTKVTL